MIWENKNGKFIYFKMFMERGWSCNNNGGSGSLNYVKVSDGSALIYVN